MITAQATRIEQALDLGSREVQNFLILQLPNGEEVRAPISETTTRFLLEAEPDVGPSPAPSIVAEKPAPTPPQEDEDEDDLDSDPGEETQHAWEDIPDQILTPTLKAAFRAVQAPEKMTLEEIVSLRDRVLDAFTQEDWDLLDVPNPAADLVSPVSASAGLVPASAPPAQPAPPPPQPAPQPPAAPPSNGQVQWADGTPMFTHSRPARTVQKDDYGYPIVPGGIDPGEVVATGYDADEDGVGQL